MAKQYEMLLKLGAQLGSEFGGTFTSAQKIISQTQKEIQKLNKEQSGIKAFEKQSADVKKAQDAYEDYQKKLANVRSEISNTGTASAELKNKEIDLERAVENANLKLSEKQAKLDSLGAALRDAGINTEDLAGESKNLSEKIKELENAEEGAADEAQELSKSGVKAFESIGEALAAAGILEGLERIGEAYMECVELSAEFDSQMSSVEAISGASAADMGLLSEKAKKMGADTKFTAIESGEALEYMAMAGWKTEDMLGGLEGIMYLAAASNEELGLTSDIVTDALTAFGLKASDATHFADVLAIASSNANTNVSMMGQTFKYAAPLAGTLGYSIEDVALAAGLMANSGIKAEQAGTALRAMFTRLSAPPKEAEEALKQLGVSIENTDGTAKPLRDTIAELSTAFSGLTDIEKTAYASSIAGQNAMSGFLALVNAAPEDVAKLTSAVDDASGAAQRMANIRLDNLAGQTELFNSVLDATKMTIGDAFAPEMEELVKSATAVLNKINEFLAKNPEVTRAILAFVGTLGAVAAGYITVKGAIAAVTAANKLLSLSMSLTPWGLALTGIAAVTAAVIALNSAEKEESLIQSSMNDKLAESEVACRNASKAFGENSAEAQKMRREYETLKLEAQDLAENERYLSEEVKAHEEAAKSANAEYVNTMNALDEEEESALALVGVLEDLTSKTELTTTEHERLEMVVDELNSRYSDLGITIDETTGKINYSTDKIRKSIEESLRMDEYIAKHKKWLENQNTIDAYKTDIEALKKNSDAKQKIANEEFNNLQQTLSKMGLVNPKSENIDAEVSKIMFAGIPFITNKAHKAAQDALMADFDTSDKENDIRLLEEENAEIDEWLKNFDEQRSAIGDSVELNVDLTSAIETLGEAYTEAYDAAYESITGQYELWDKAAKVIPKDIDDIGVAMDTQIAYWTDYYTDLENLSSRSGIDGLEGFVSKFADGSEDSVNMVAALAAATDEDIQALIEKSSKLDEAQAKAASGVADLETGLTSSIVSEFESMIEGLELDEESAAAAKSTVDAYIEQLLAGETRAATAAAGIRNAVNASLWSSLDVVGQHYRSGGYDGYANGTTSATPGWHLVGEKGPELMHFGGGETVLDAQTTRQALGGTSVTISVPVTVQGNADSDTANSIGDSVVDKVLDVLRELGIDSRRGAYA